METFQISEGDESRSIVPFGFGRQNILQLSYHFVLAVFIGVTLRLTTFTEATTISKVIGDTYKVKTSFLVSFGFTKAVSNLLVGRVSDSYGRKIPHSIGWIFGILLGIILLVLLRRMTGADVEDRQSWIFWYIFANICLGAQQGWTWTTNIFMFMDVAGPGHRAFSSGLSNSLGYLSSALASYAAAILSAETAFRVVLLTSAVGWAISAYLVNDTSAFVEQEIREVSYAPSSSQPSSDTVDEWEDEDGSRDMEVEKHAISQTSMLPGGQEQSPLVDSDGSFYTVFAVTSWTNRSTAILCAGGLFANLITSFAWGLVLIWGQQQGLSSVSLANVGSAFTFTKGITMFLSGYFSDRQQDRKRVIMGGFLLAVVGLIITAAADLTNDLRTIYIRLFLGGIIIGFGIGSVYCVMTAALSDHTLPKDRASAIGVYKFWRDSGYAFGGLLTGWITDISGGNFAFVTLVVAVLVVGLASGMGLLYREATGSSRIPPL